MRKTISWDELFLNLCFELSKKSKDDSTQCGAVLVDSKHKIISCGYNGPPPGINDELVPWNNRPEKYAYIIHAEENALWFGVAAKSDLAGSTMYCTHHPCTECVARMILNNVRECIIPHSHTTYPMSKYQVSPSSLLEAQPYPKLLITPVEYNK